jgi:hypothetical protein
MVSGCQHFGGTCWTPSWKFYNKDIHPHTRVRDINMPPPSPIHAKKISAVLIKQSLLISNSLVSSE